MATVTQTQVKLYALIGRCEWFYNGSTFEENLLHGLGVAADEPDFAALSEHIKQSPSKHPEDLITDLFQTEVTMDFDFAKSLNMHDIVNPFCFIPVSEVGKSIIELSNYEDLFFIVAKKRYSDMHTLAIDFIVAHDDFEYEVISILNE